MQKEIETRFLEIDKEALIQKLASLGAQDKGEVKLEETIFHAADGSWIGKRKFVRLRKKNSTTVLTYKENEAQTIDSAREIEFEVSDATKCAQFFERVGLSAMRKLEKYRHTFVLGDVTIDIDSWPKIPPYVEIEGPSVESLEKFCSKAGLDWSQKFDGDAKAAFAKYGYNLDKITVITFTEFVTDTL